MPYFLALEEPAGVTLNLESVQAYRSDLFGEWVLLAGPGSDPFQPTLPVLLGRPDRDQLSLFDSIEEQCFESLRADRPEAAWVVYLYSEWPWLELLSAAERLRVHQVKRIFGGVVFDVDDDGTGSRRDRPHASEH